MLLILRTQLLAMFWHVGCVAGFQDVGIGDFGRCCKDVTVEWQPPRLGPGKSYLDEKMHLSVAIMDFMD